jgi:hypothetical protein
MTVGKDKLSFPEQGIIDNVTHMRVFWIPWQIMIAVPGRSEPTMRDIYPSSLHFSVGECLTIKGSRPPK